MKIKDRTINQDFLKGAPMEEIPCRLCGGRDFKTLARRDGIGLAVQTVMCRVCGLIFINPRPTQEWYKTFYSSLGGHQHEYKQSGYTGDAKPVGWGFERARRHGRALAERLEEYLMRGVTIDVGSSEGGVLAGLKDVLEITPVGIEPVPSEAKYAAERGIPTHAALIENIESAGLKLPPASNIICVKSLNHFLNPAYFFSWAWKTLKPGGRLILEVKNFRHQARRSGRIYYGIQIDHPYMYVPETLSALVRYAGFDVLFLDVDEGKSKEAIKEQRSFGLPVSHIRIAAQKTPRRPFAEPFVPAPGTVREVEFALYPFNLYFHYLWHYANLRRSFLSRLGIK